MVTVNVDTARSRLRYAAERHCPRCYPGSMVKTGPEPDDWEPVASGVASGLELDAAALDYASAARREHPLAKITVVAVAGGLLGNVATLMATEHAPPWWLICLVATLAALVFDRARRS